MVKSAVVFECSIIANISSSQPDKLQFVKFTLVWIVFLSDVQAGSGLVSVLPVDLLEPGTRAKTGGAARTTGDRRPRTFRAEVKVENEATSRSKWLHFPLLHTLKQNKTF